MGHERIGVLPKTKRWRAIVEEIAGVESPSVDIPRIASQTLVALGSRYVSLSSDASIEAAFEYLVDLSRAGASAPDRRASALEIVAELKKRLGEVEGSLETREIARRAGSDAIAAWGRANASQSELFSDTAGRNPWAGLSSGSGFCELSRLFFASLTERYLNYFLDRETSAAIPDLSSRDDFRRQLERHIGDVSKHSFEIAKITESFAAGWFNKYAKQQKPTRLQIRKFLSYAFAKLREDLRREGR